MSRVLTVALVGAVCLFAGCDKETTLHSGLVEQQANLVMAALLDAGISCHKTPGEEGTWKRSLPRQRFCETLR